MSSTHTHGSLSSTSTHNSISFLRVSKTKTGKDKTKKKAEEKEEQWYIPYKGPYEPAPTSGLKKSVSRDSWGDPVPGTESGVGDGDGVDSYQGGVDERSRSDQHHAPSTAQDVQQRPRSQSQPNQNEPHQLRPGYSGQSPKISSYINLDAAGGVGHSPSRHMLHAGDGTGRPWSAREAREKEGAGAPRTLRQRSSLASLFEKKYSLLKKWGFGGGRSAENREQPQPPTESPRRPLDHNEAEDRDRRDRKEESGDIMVVARSPETRSMSLYSQPSFVPVTHKPIVRLTPPPTVPADHSPPPLTASSISSFASHQRTLSSADSTSHSRSNSHSNSQHSASAPAAVPLGTVDEDDTHVDSYYDMLITSSVNTPLPPIESPTTARPRNGVHPYASASTFPYGHIDDSDPVYSRKQKTRLSPIPQSRPSLTTMRSIASSPDLRQRGTEMEGVDMSRLRPHIREKLQSTGGGKERWLSTNLIAIFLPKPKFKIKAKSNEKDKSRSAIDLASSGGDDNHRQDTHHMSEFGVVPRLSDTTRRKSYAYDDLSLLSLDRVLEEGDKLEQDRMKWQAQAVKSLGNKHTRIMSRSRSKSLTQAGRKMKSIPGQPPPAHRTRGQQSSIDFLAARACLGDQDRIPLVGKDDAVGRKLQFEFPRHSDRDKHERMPSGSSGLATSSGSNGISAQSSLDHNANGRHKRNDSWSQSAVRIAKSVPQLCGVVNDDNDKHQPHPAKNEVTLLNPITSDNTESRKLSPSPSSSSGVPVGIAISTPPRDYHPYTIGADRGVAERIDDDEDSSGRPPPDIRLPDHPYAQGGLSSSISRCVAGEREPDYVGPHPAVATKEFMANLGLSELSARHRLPPQVMLAQHPPPQALEQQQQQQPPPEKQKSSNQLYVKVDDTRNSYQDLQPYVRVDSNAQPSDRLWVTYSPGTVKEVMPNEVFQYSPHIPNQDVVGSNPASTSASGGGAGTDFFLQRYQRMSTVYQDTAAMSQALGDAMYDSEDARRSSEEKATVSQEQPRYTITPPPRVLFGPRINTTPPKHTESPSNLSSSRVSSPILPLSSPTSAFDAAVSAASPEHSSPGTATSPPTSPTVPRVGSPDNLEPFRGLFYHPPGGSESDSSSPSPGEEGEEHLLDDPQGLTTLIKEVNDEWEQMALERQKDEQRSVRSSNTLQSQRPSTSDSGSTSTTSKGGGNRSRRINTEAGPLDFVLDRSMLPQQDPPTTQSGYVPRPNRVSTFYPSTPIPEDVEFSRASSPFEETVEGSNINQPVPRTYPTEEEYMSLDYPDGTTRASYLTTTDTLSRISTLSDFPVPPNGMTPQEISMLTAQPR